MQCKTRYRITRNAIGVDFSVSHFNEERVVNSMAAHWLSLRTTVGAVENLDVICDSIAWLSGEPDSTKVDKTKSHHGSSMYSVTCKLTKNKSIQCVLDNLGDD